MIEQMLEQESFQKQLLALYQGLRHSDPLARLRAKGWDHFLELGLPTKRMEQFQYVRLRHLYAKQLVTSQTIPLTPAAVAPYVLPECANSVLVFHNGQLDLGVSNIKGLPKKAVAIPLQEALRSFGSFINNQVAKGLLEEIDPFAAMNSAFIQNALFLYFPPNTILESPLQILQVVDAEQELISPRVEVFFGALSEGKVIQTYAHCKGKNYLFNNVVNFALEEGAHVTYAKTCFHEPDDAWHFEATRAVLKKDSSFKTVTVQDGAQSFRDDYRMTLVGPNAEVNLNGVWILSGKREAHTHVFIDHQAPDCRSQQLFKGALDGASRSSFEGKIYIHKQAQKTLAYQLNQNLLLSENAQADSKPNLEIFADDVKASHGATVGQLDAEQLFYLRTRGMDKKAAEQLLVEGFCCEVIDMLPVKSQQKIARDATPLHK